jgi:hypothetical protein
VLPLNVREYLKNTLNTIDYDTFIGSPNEEFCKTMFDKFLIEIKKQDTAKEINLKDYLPELAQMINWT